MSLIIKAAAYVTGRLWSRWEKLCADPATAQNRLLLDIVRRNRASAFGKDHGFADVHSLVDYRNHVAIGDYERLRTRHHVRYACADCSADKERARSGEPGEDR